MTIKWKRALLPIIVLALSIGVFTAINSNAQVQEEKKAVDTRPTVSVETLIASDHQVVITSYGEIKPLESTQLATQVSGEVIHWNPDFIPGGFVKRGDILFSIERDNYEAQVLTNEAALISAQSALIQEQASAHVAKEEANRSPNVKHSDLYLRKPQLLSAQAAVKSAQASLKIARRDLAKCDVKAPYDALVISKNIGLGQFVSVGSPVAILNNIESAEVTVPVAGFDSRFLPAKVAGLSASVSVSVSVSQKGINTITRKGEISRDLGVVDSNTRMSNLVIRVNDPYGLNSDVTPLKFGSYVEVNFYAKTLKNVYRLHQELVNNRIVWVVNENNELEARKVEIIKEEGEFFLISEGLKDQDQLVLTLPEYPQKGQVVKISGAQDTQTVNADNTSDVSDAANAEKNTSTLNKI